MSSEEAVLTAIYELVDRSIYVLEDEPEVPHALKLLKAAEILVANELHSINKRNKNEN